MPNSHEIKQQHVAVFPFPFSSHPKPLLNLVLKLANVAPTFSFSIISTEQSNQTLFSNIHTPNNIKHYTISDGIPKGHVLGKNPVEIVNLFLQSGPENFQKGINLAESETEQKVTCIIADAFVTPTFTIAKTLNIPWIPVWIPVSCSISVHLYGDTIRAKCSNNVGTKKLDFIPGLHMIRVQDLPHDVLMLGTEKETLLTRVLASLAKVLPESKAVIVSFFEELDPPIFVQDMKSKLQNFLYIPLTLPPPNPTVSISENDDETGCLSWLDTQKPKSVVYVSFGTTVVELPTHELVALAEALEESRFPFIWSLKENLKAFLPNGFLERTRNSGKVLAWTPQARILGHGSVGVFVTQGGCNSVIEGMSNGVPMICRPYFADQGINSRLVADVWENGMIVEGRVFTKNGVLKGLNLILVQEEGKKFRENGLKVKQILKEATGPKGRSHQDFKTLVELISSS